MVGLHLRSPKQALRMPSSPGMPQDSPGNLPPSGLNSRMISPSEGLSNPRRAAGATPAVEVPEMRRNQNRPEMRPATANEAPHPKGVVPWLVKSDRGSCD